MRSGMPDPSAMIALAVAAAVGCGGRVDHASSPGQGDGGNSSASAGHSVAPRLVGGGEFACALTGRGGVACWGNNIDGQLGNGTTTGSDAAVQVPKLTSGVTALSAGSTSACAVMGGAVLCWGANCGGEADGGNVCLGADGSAESAASGSLPGLLTPTPVTAFASGVTAVGVGDGALCALRSLGIVDCVGYAGVTWDRSDIGFGSVPGMEPLTGATALSVGSASACAILAGGRLVCRPARERFHRRQPDAGAGHRSHEWRDGRRGVATVRVRGQRRGRRLLGQQRPGPAGEWVHR
jgi:hypothetical protein